MDARPAVQRLDFEPRVVGECGQSCRLRPGAGLDYRVLFVGGPRFVGVRSGANAKNGRRESG
jgi:hypothetical protein